MNGRFKGALCGIFSAMAYGTNPFGAMFLYQDGLNTASVLVWRFLAASLVLALIMLMTHKSFALSLKETAVLFFLGALFAASAMLLFLSFRYMATGLAASLFFIYPVLVAVAMALFYRERLSRSAVFALCAAMAGVFMLSDSEGAAFSLKGAACVLGSALTYTAFVVVLNKSSVRMSTVKLSLYQTLFSFLCVLACTQIFESCALMLPMGFKGWFFVMWLALVTAVFSQVTLVISVREIGSTMTSILGALEPLTALLIGIFVFGESLTPSMVLGVAFIIFAVLLIVLSDQLKEHKVRHIMSALGQTVLKRWRWR